MPIAAQTSSSPTQLDAIPDWVLPYWPTSPLEQGRLDKGTGLTGELADRAEDDATVLLVGVKNHPTEETVRAAINLRPDAEPMLRRWQAMWDVAAVGRMKSSLHTNPIPFATKSRQNHLEKEYEAILRGDHRTAARNRILHDAWTDLASYRNPLLHVIDDASSFLSLEHALPHRAFLLVDEDAYELIGHREDGSPILSYKGRAEVLQRKRKRRTAMDRYWRCAAYLKASKRRHAMADNALTAVAMLGAMRKAGHDKAFVKGRDSKTGTWIVDMHDCRSLEDIAGVYAKALFPTTTDFKVLIQEHLPFTHEQRFFVIGGKVVASVCSDRNFCALDARPGKRLDDRVAVILNPANDAGEYDRGFTGNAIDRSMAAAFARGARALARELRSSGYDDYVIDMGMTERGVAAIEINEYNRAGPYCLDRGIIARHVSKLARAARAEAEAVLRATAREIGIESGLDAYLAGLSGGVTTDCLNQWRLMPKLTLLTHVPAFDPQSTYVEKHMRPYEDETLLIADARATDAVPLFRIPQAHFDGEAKRLELGHLVVAYRPDSGLLVARSSIEAAPARRTPMLIRDRAHLIDVGPGRTCTWMWLEGDALRILCARPLNSGTTTFLVPLPPDCGRLAWRREDGIEIVLEPSVDFFDGDGPAFYDAVLERRASVGWLADVSVDTDHPAFPNISPSPRLAPDRTEPFEAGTSYASVRRALSPRDSASFEIETHPFGVAAMILSTFLTERLPGAPSVLNLVDKMCLDIDPKGLTRARGYGGREGFDDSGEEDLVDFDMAFALRKQVAASIWNSGVRWSHRHDEDTTAPVAELLSPMTLIGLEDMDLLAGIVRDRLPRHSVPVAFGVAAHLFDCSDDDVFGVTRSWASALRRAGLDIDMAVEAENGFGFTPLHLAVRSGDLPAIAAILAEGADGGVRVQGRTVFDEIVDMSPARVVDDLEGWTKLFSVLRRHHVSPFVANGTHVVKALVDRMLFVPQNVVWPYPQRFLGLLEAFAGSGMEQAGADLHDVLDAIAMICNELREQPDADERLAVFQRMHVLLTAMSKDR